jgi:predicted nucleic acid-binding protein
MVDALLDTAVLVDVLRGHPPATSWLATQPHLGVTTVVWLEIIEGSSSLRAQRIALRLLHGLERVEVTPLDIDWAIRQLTRLGLSQGVDAMDCMIASVSYRLNLPLYTHNLKHFVPLLGPLAQKPY